MLTIYIQRALIYVMCIQQLNEFARLYLYIKVIFVCCVCAFPYVNVFTGLCVRKVVQENANALLQRLTSGNFLCDFELWPWLAA